MSFVEAFKTLAEALGDILQGMVDAINDLTQTVTFPHSKTHYQFEAGDSQPSIDRPIHRAVEHRKT